MGPARIEDHGTHAVLMGWSPTGTTLPLVAPTLATSGTVAHDRAAWSYEVKWDGWRALVYLEGGGVRVRTRTGEVSESLPEVAGLVGTLDGRSAILDGELVACPDGRPDFYALGPRMAHTGRRARWAASQMPVTFIAWRSTINCEGSSIKISLWSG